MNNIWTKEAIEEATLKFWGGDGRAHDHTRVALDAAVAKLEEQGHAVAGITSMLNGEKVCNCLIIREQSK
jgi:hypothetical protein